MKWLLIYVLFNPKPKVSCLHLIDAPEEVGDVAAVRAEELQGMRMVVLHALRDVDDVRVALLPEHVVLREVPVDQFACRGSTHAPQWLPSQMGSPNLMDRLINDPMHTKVNCHNFPVAFSNCLKWCCCCCCFCCCKYCHCFHCCFAVTFFYI